VGENRLFFALAACHNGPILRWSEGLSCASLTKFGDGFYGLGVFKLTFGLPAGLNAALSV
jgi:hypothetical protein